MYSCFTFYATTCAEKYNHQLVVATTGAFTLTSVTQAGKDIFLLELTALRTLVRRSILPELTGWSKITTTYFL